MTPPHPGDAPRRTALPTWFASIDTLTQQMEMLEKSRPQGLWGIAVDRDPEALLWQKSCLQIQWLFRGLHWLTTIVPDDSPHRDQPTREQEA